jgi:SagB-type dehydrogenase family enzyme
VILRRAYSLISFWDEGRLCIVNFQTNNHVISNPFLFQIIDSARGYITENELIAQFKKIPGVLTIVRLLINKNILLKKDSAKEKRDLLLFNNWKWGTDAKFFHFSTKEVAYTFDFDKIRQVFEKKAITNPPPSPFKTEKYHDKIPLSKISFPERDFWDVLFTRRTCREFSDMAITKEQLSAFLKAVFGMTQYYNSSQLDTRIIKTSPSGGARHPIEVYPIIRNVKGIKQGVYHFEVETNSLVPVNSALDSKKLNSIFSGQYWVETAAVCFVFTAVLSRSMWKYDHSRAYRVLLLDSGHLGQTFHLAGTALGLGVFTTAAIQDKKIEKLLKIDGISEIVIYAGAIGHKTKIKKNQA